MGFPLNALSQFIQTLNLGNGNYGTITQSFDTAWLIPEENRVGPKLPMRILFPRPDGETHVNSFHRNAHSEILYKVPVTVQGGERPFRYEIVSAPVGATIVEELDRTTDVATGKIIHTRGENYGVISWTPTSGTHTFTVKVIDQGLNEVTVTWSVVLDDTKFVIIDSNVETTGSGTWESPLKTWADLWGIDSNATYANKIAYFKNGTYQVKNSTNGSVSINSNVKPLAYIGESKEGVIFDTSIGHIFINIGNFALCNVTFDGSRTTDNNNRMIQISTKANNYLFDNIEFDNITAGLVVDDNPACLMFTDSSGTYTQNVSIINCSSGTNCEVALLTTFTIDGILVENCLIQTIPGGFSASNGGTGIHIKDDTRNCTVAFNKFEGTFPSYHLGLNNQQGALNGSGNQEACYNILIDTDDTDPTSGSPYYWNQNSVTYPNPPETYSYRNTIITIRTAHVFQAWVANSVPVQVTADLWTGYAFAAGSSSGYENVGSPSIQLTSSDFDANGYLTNANGARTTYLGKAGAEISS